MRSLLISEEKINGLVAVLFGGGLGVLQYIGYPLLWSGIVLSLGVSLIIRQLLVNRAHDLFFIIIVLGGIWASTHYNFRPAFFVPLLLYIGAAYVLVDQIVCYSHRRYRLKHSGGRPNPEEHRDDEAL